MSLPSQGAWIEIKLTISRKNVNESLPSQGAWIEISEKFTTADFDKVAPLTGSVD